MDAWEVDLGYLAPSMVRDTIDSVYFSDKDDEGVSIYKTYFEQNYASWAPEKR